MSEGPGSGREEIQGQAIRGVTWTVVHTGLALAVGFGVNLLLARLLGVEEFGRLAYLTMLMDIAGAVLSLGIHIGLMQYGAKAHAQGRYEVVEALLSKVQGFGLLVMAPVLTVLLCVLAQVSPPLLLLGVVFGVWVPLGVSGASASLGLENKTSTGAKIAIVTNLVTQAVVLTVLFTVKTADAVWIARSVTSALAGGAAIFFVRPSYRRAALIPRLPRRFPPGFWHFALPAGVASVLTLLVVSRSEVVVLQLLSTPTQVGLFALAYGLANHLYAPAQAVIGPLIPAVSGISAIEPQSVRAAYLRTLRTTSTGTALILSIALAPFVLLLPTLYGEDFRASGPMLLVLGLMGGVAMLSAPTQVFVLSRLRGGTLLRVSVISLMVDVGVAVVAVPVWGAWGAVLAQVVTGFTQLALLLGNELRTGLHDRRLVLVAAAPTVCGALASVTAYLATARVGQPVLAAILAAILGLAVYVVLLRVTRAGVSTGDVAAISRNVPTQLAGPTQWVLQQLMNQRLS